MRSQYKGFGGAETKQLRRFGEVYGAHSNRNWTGCDNQPVTIYAPWSWEV